MSTTLRFLIKIYEAEVNVKGSCFSNERPLSRLLIYEENVHKNGIVLLTVVLT